jgi:hypothetical protein
MLLETTRAKNDVRSGRVLVGVLSESQENVPNLDSVYVQDCDARFERPMNILVHHAPEGTKLI